MTDNLEDGFYWVRIGGDWLIARKFLGDLTFHEDPYLYEGIPKFIQEIDPRPIKRDNRNNT